MGSKAPTPAPKGQVKPPPPAPPPPKRTPFPPDPFRGEYVGGLDEHGRTMVGVPLDFETMSKLEAMRQAMGFRTTFGEVIAKLVSPEKTEADERALR